MTYKEKLKNPKWQKKRLEIFQRDNFTCMVCGKDTITLHVHHLKYTSGDPWDIDNKYLLTVCENCHKSEHEHPGWIEYNRPVVLTMEERIAQLDSYEDEDLWSIVNLPQEHDSMTINIAKAILEDRILEDRNSKE